MAVARMPDRDIDFTSNDPITTLDLDNAVREEEARVAEADRTRKAHEDRQAEMRALQEADRRARAAKAAAVTTEKAKPPPIPDKKPKRQEKPEPPLPGYDSFYEPPSGTSDSDDMAGLTAGVEAHRPTQRPSAKVRDTVTVFTADERVQFLNGRYGVLGYKGVILPVDGKAPYTRDTYKYKRQREEANAKGVPTHEIYQHPAKLFARDSCLKNHVSGGDNLAIYTPAEKSMFAAFEFDDSTGENTAEMLISVKKTIAGIHSLGLESFCYDSGGKGWHVEIFFDSPVDVNKLHTLKRIIISLYRNKGGKYMDKTYPANTAYRVFGSWHYKAKRFSQAFKINVQLHEDGIRRKVDLTPCETPDASWEHFANAPINNSDLLDDIIAQNLQYVTPEPKSVKENRRDRRNIANHQAKPLIYNPIILKRVHETGLYGDYRRHDTSYHLGRYFRHHLNLTEPEAKEHITVWLQRHYEDFRSTLQAKNIAPFCNQARCLIKSAYDACCYDTLINCMAGFTKGQPFLCKVANAFAMPKLESKIHPLFVTVAFTGR